VNSSELYGVSPLFAKVYKEYTRGGKVFIRKYKREVNGGMSVLDMMKRINQIAIEHDR